MAGYLRRWDHMGLPNPIFRGHDAAETALGPVVANEQPPKRCYTANGLLSVEDRGELERSW